MKISQETPNLVEIWCKYWSLSMKPKYLFMVAGDTKLHKSAVFEGNSITLLG